MTKREKGRNRSTEGCQVYKDVRGMSSDSGVWGRATRRTTGPVKRLGEAAGGPGESWGLCRLQRSLTNLCSSESHRTTG